MKNPVFRLIVFVAILISCALLVFLFMKKSRGNMAPPASESASLEESADAGEDEPSDAENAVVAANVPAAEPVSAAGNAAAGNTSATGNEAAVAGNEAGTENEAATNATAKEIASAKESVSARETVSAKENVSPGAASPSGAETAAAGVRTSAGTEASAAGSSAGTPASAANPSAASAGVAAVVASQSGSASANPSSAGRQQARTERGTDAFAALSGGADAYQYFEYQVVAVPKKTLAAAAESMGLPKDSPPSDELLPAIYKEGGYRVIGYSAGYSAASTPVEFRMSRSEFFPDFYILPKGIGDMDDSSGEIPPPDGEDADEEDDGNDDAESDDGDDEEDDEDDDENDSGFGIGGNFMNSYNNLASILPFFGDPTVFGNEFYLDIRPPRIFSMDSNMRKLNGFTNTDYGEWGTGQSPVFDDNSFGNTLSATKGKPMIVAQSQTSNTWTLHVFFTQALPMPEKLVPADGSENKLVRLDFQIVRAKWNELCAAGDTDGCPGLPSESILEKLSAKSQLRDLYCPTFRLIPSQEPVSIQLNTRTQFIPLKWIPAQDPGIPAIPLNSEAIWTGTALKAAARILNDGRTVRLEYDFEKTSQTGWRNYGYSFYDVPEEPPAPAQNRYARPQQQQQLEPPIQSGLLKLPMIDTTAFRQALYLDVGKPVLAARISNPAYQPDTLTLLFVTATVEDAP